VKQEVQHVVEKARDASCYLEMSLSINSCKNFPILNSQVYVLPLYALH